MHECGGLMTGRQLIHALLNLKDLDDEVHVKAGGFHNIITGISVNESFTKSIPDCIELRIDESGLPYAKN
jgi:hypothetical protein